MGGGAHTLLGTYYLGTNYSTNVNVSLKADSNYELQIRPGGSSILAGFEIKVQYNSQTSKNYIHNGNNGSTMVSNSPNI